MTKIKRLEQLEALTALFAEDLLIQHGLNDEQNEINSEQIEIDDEIAASLEEAVSASDFEGMEAEIASLKLSRESQILGNSHLLTLLGEIHAYLGVERVPIWRGHCVLRSNRGRKSFLPDSTSGCCPVAPAPRYVFVTPVTYNQ